MHKCSHLRGPLALLAAVLGLGLALLAATPAGAANADWTNSAAWSDASVTQPGATSSPTAVSCADKDSCLAVDSQGYGTSYDGTNWSAAHDTGIGVRLLSCVSSTACFGVSNKNSYVTFNGTSAGSVHTLAPQPPDWDATVSSLSCKSTSFCMAAVDENHGSSYISYVYRFDGSSWHRSTSVTKGQDASVSCATPSYCVAVSSGLSSSQVGEAQVFNGRGWTKPQPIDPKPKAFAGQQDHMSSVACPRTGFCLATDSQGSATTFNGQRWSSPVQTGLKGSTDAPMETQVTCASSHFCLVGQGNGDRLGDSGAYVVAFNGHAWATPETVRSVTDQFYWDATGALACPSAFYCLLGGSSRVDVSTDQSTRSFSAAKAPPAPHKAPNPSVSGVGLSGVGTHRPRLSFHVKAGTGHLTAIKVKSYTTSMPFATSAARLRAHIAVTSKGKKLGFSVTHQPPAKGYNADYLTIKPATAASADVVINYPAISAVGDQQRVTVGVSAQDSGGGNHGVEPWFKCSGSRCAPTSAS